MATTSKTTTGSTEHLASPAGAASAAGSAALYEQQPHPYQPRNVNARHKAELQQAGFNTRVAVWLTRNVGTMQCAYIFAGIGIGSLIGVFTNNVFLAALFGSVSSYFLQLVLLPVLSVGQNVLGRHAELLAEEQYQTTMRTYHELQQQQAHLNAQDVELLRQTSLLLQLVGGSAATAPPSLPSPSPAPSPTPSPAPPAKPQRARATKTPKAR